MVTKGDLEASVVMVGDSAAAIMARQGSARIRGRRPMTVALVLAVVIAAMVMIVAASRPRSGPPANQPTRQTVGLTGLSSAELAAARGALAAYGGYLDAYAAAGATANPVDPRLLKFAGDPALNEVQSSLQMLARGGLAYRGGFKGEVHVTKVSLDTHTVSLASCQDISELTVVAKSTGRPLPSATQNLRYPVNVEARFFDGRWLIVEATADRTRKC